MIDKNGPSEDEQAVRFMVISKILDLAGQIVNGAIWIALAYIGYLAIDSLAGKTTVANIVLKYLTAEESDYGFPWILVGAFAIWAVLERRLRKRKIESLQGHIRELEKRLDPNRTTSGLLPTGDTNPEDKDL